jgi:hypothetical protein
MPLPTKKTSRRLNIYDQTIFLYGRPKLGKSSFCAGADEVVFFATEPGLKSLEVYEIEIVGWTASPRVQPDGRIQMGFIEACKEIASGRHSFRTVAIDTIDNLWKFCVDHVCEKRDVEHLTDLGFGKGTDMASAAFHRTLTALCRLPYGVVMVSHAQEREIETPSGSKVSKIMPTIPERAQRVVLGMADMILYYDIAARTGPDGKRQLCRVLRTKQSDKYEAGDRTGCLPPIVDLGTEPLRSYSRFLEAYVHGGGTAAGVTPSSASSAAAFDEESQDAGKPPAPLPQESTAPPPPAQDQSDVPAEADDWTAGLRSMLSQERLEAVRAKFRAATSAAELTQVAGEAKQVLSKGEQDAVRGDFNARKRELAGVASDAASSAQQAEAAQS